LWAQDNPACYAAGVAGAGVNTSSALQKKRCNMCAKKIRIGTASNIIADTPRYIQIPAPVSVVESKSKNQNFKEYMNHNAVAKTKPKYDLKPVCSILHSPPFVFYVETGD
jgi:hypothetical protein